MEGSRGQDGDKVACSHEAMILVFVGSVPLTLDRCGRMMWRQAGSKFIE